MRLSLNDHSEQVSFQTSTSTYIQVRKSRTVGRWKLILKWPAGEPPHTSYQPNESLHVQLQFHLSPIILLTTTSPTEESIHLQFTNSPPSPTLITQAPSDIPPTLSISIQSTSNFYLSPNTQHHINLEGTSSPSPNQSRILVNTGSHQMDIELIDQKEILLAKYTPPTTDN